MPNWIAPETAAQAPKATSVEPASEPNAAMEMPTIAAALIAALIRSVRPSATLAPRSEAITSISGYDARRMAAAIGRFVAVVGTLSPTAIRTTAAHTRAAPARATVIR